MCWCEGLTMTTMTMTTMWEVRAAAECVEELLAWLSTRLPAGAQLYRSVDSDVRVVVIDPTGTARDAFATVPAALVARPAHAWDFQFVRAGATHPGPERI
jgi:hypothetical protein